MLTHEENMLVTRTSPETPMGEVMRRYWIPALISEEVPEPDCPPVRVQLLGEQRGLSRHARENWPAGRILPAPPGLPVARAQRGVWPALRVSRLEV